MRRTAAVLLPFTLLAGTAGLAACGGGDEVVIEATPAAMAAAGQATLDAGTARTETVVRVDLSAMGIDQPIEMTIAGVQDLANTRASMTTDMGALFDAIAEQTGESVPEAMRGEMRYVQDGNDLYMCGGFMALLGGAECLHVDFEEVTGADLSALSGGAGSDPTALMASLAGVEGIEEIGPEQAAGVDTTHFAGTITMRDSLAAATPEQAQAIQDMLDHQGLGDEFLDTSLDVDLWIDDQGRVRQLHQRADDVQVGGSTASYDIEVRFLEFGVPVEIDIPDDFVEASDVPGFGG